MIVFFVRFLVAFNIKRRHDRPKSGACLIYFVQKQVRSTLLGTPGDEQKIWYTHLLSKNIIIIMESMSPKSNAVRVLQFHRAIGVDFPNVPTVPDKELIALRETLIDEEYAEVKQAWSRLAGGGRRELVALVHELADLLYVAYGGILACGVDPDEIFDEVHRANMRKVSGPRRPDGKQLKPADWQPADVAGVLARQEGKLNGQQIDRGE